MKRYDVPDRIISNAFCDQCGSGLPYVSKSGKALVVQAGTLDLAFNSSPQMRNIFWEERAAWYDEGVIADKFDTFPG